ncbi:MAG: hypothetical protein CL946_13105 [Ectothiorhodospiraceae bacterium]|nr:hypothetical protein [Ectothiorhodospiraceae bacterium]
MAAGLTFEQLQKKYLGIFLALLVLTALTVGVSFFHFGDVGNIIIGILIAVTKAALVAMIFMHLQFDKAWLRYFVIVPVFFFLAIVFALTVLEKF